jgi:acetylornithine deacetylase/succinyl-diaminopimelate desuccinylase-like protein
MSQKKPPLVVDAEFTRQVLDLACDIQQIPSPTFGESRRAAWVLEQFRREGLSAGEIDRAGNALACLPGSGSARPLVVSAHLDTVFPLETDLSLTHTPAHIAGPGIGDNSLGVAGLLGLVRLLRAQGMRLPGDLWLAANVGEEGLGDLKGMRAIVARFGGQPLAYLILEGIGLGEIYHRGLPIQRYRVEVRTPGGHSWSDYGHPSAIHELACLITRLTALPIPHSPRTSLNVGVIHGGTTINTLAAHAWAEIDLRSVSAEILSGLSAQLHQIAAETDRDEVECRVESIGQRPAGEIPLRHPLVSLAMRTIQELGLTAHTGIGSTDANAPLAAGFPAICIGLTTGSGAHTMDEFIRVEPLSLGLEQLYRLVTRCWEEMGK